VAWWCSGWVGRGGEGAVRLSPPPGGVPHLAILCAVGGRFSKNIYFFTSCLGVLLFWTLGESRPHCPSLALKKTLVRWRFCGGGDVVR